MAFLTIFALNWRGLRRRRAQRFSCLSVASGALRHLASRRPQMTRQPRNLSPALYCAIGNGPRARRQKRPRLESSAPTRPRLANDLRDRATGDRGVALVLEEVRVGCARDGLVNAVPRERCESPLRVEPTALRTPRRRHDCEWFRTERCDRLRLVEHPRQRCDFRAVGPKLAR